METEQNWICSHIPYCDDAYHLSKNTKGRKLGYDCWPAPSMAEVWRELPEKYNGGRKCLMMVEGINVAGYSAGRGFDSSLNFTSNNPTDALIDLLIWVRKEAPDES